jgi:hypothetical protein
MAQGKVPTPYVNDVKEDRSVMQYVEFEVMGIGARKSGLPTDGTNGVKSLQHVGDDASRGAGKNGSTAPDGRK